MQQAEAAVRSGNDALVNNQRQKELQDARIAQADEGVRSAEADITAAQAGIQAAKSTIANAQSAIDAIQAAEDLAGLIGTMHQLDPTGAPRGRGVSLAERDREIRYWLDRFEGDPIVTTEWERALGAAPWDREPVWHHGDLDCRNWLVRDGRISGVIDCGAMGVGDPACDVMVAWKLHSKTSFETSLWSSM